MKGVSQPDTPAAAYALLVGKRPDLLLTETEGTILSAVDDRQTGRRVQLAVYWRDNGVPLLEYLGEMN